MAVDYGTVQPSHLPDPRAAAAQLATHVAHTDPTARNRIVAEVEKAPVDQMDCAYLMGKNTTVKVHVPTFLSMLAQAGFGSPKLASRIVGDSISHIVWGGELEAEASVGRILTGQGKPLILQSRMIIDNAYAHQGVAFDPIPVTIAQPGTTTSVTFPLPTPNNSLPASIDALARQAYDNSMQWPIMAFLVSISQREQFRARQTANLTFRGAMRRHGEAASGDSPDTPAGTNFYGFDYEQSYQVELVDGNFEGLFLFSREESSGRQGFNVLAPLLAMPENIVLRDSAGANVTTPVQNPEVSWTGLTDATDTISVQPIGPGSNGFETVFARYLPRYK